jgi:hypothetical protein
VALGLHLSSSFQSIRVFWKGEEVLLYNVLGDQDHGQKPRAQIIND